MSHFHGKKHHEGVRINVIKRYERVGGGPISEGKKRYATLEWPLYVIFINKILYFRLLQMMHKAICKVEQRNCQVYNLV